MTAKLKTANSWLSSTQTNRTQQIFHLQMYSQKYYVVKYFKLFRTFSLTTSDILQATISFQASKQNSKVVRPTEAICMLSKHNVSISHLVHMAVLNHKTLKSHLQRIQIRSYRSLVFTLVVFLKITVNIEYMITKTYKNKVWLLSALLHYTPLFL